MTDTPKRLRKINALSQNKNRKHPAMQRINEELEQCCPHAVVAAQVAQVVLRARWWQLPSRS